ncbi:acid protease [Zopfia rhizophila CBS 207.26]|uniref:Acid protease n=1 Tax=Zopfia rhizophila CBS 207.26 TaxID=1314779 RepID=A0A6A6DX63_9PEZI|nr:acid protease [Zopfia rhizophila CBS 207.26]
MHIPPPVFMVTAACLSILPTVHAFYPYQPVYGGSDKPTEQRRATRPVNSEYGSITLPLRRVPIRRENQHNIIKSNDPKQESSVAIDQDGTDLSYMVAVTIGSSTEEYLLLLDSAASNTWVMGQDCTSDACDSHNTFGEGDSSTLKKGEEAFSITYGTGSVSGIVASDTLHLANLSPSLSFGLGTNVSDEFKAYPMDGILGIGRGDTIPGTVESPQLMDVLSTSRLIKAKLFGIHLSRTKDGLNDGELNLGEPNKERYDGDLNFIPVVESSVEFWELPIDDAGVDGKKLGVKGRSAIIDSGTSFILMPSDDAAALHKLIPGSEQSGETFTVPCKATQPVQLVFGGKTYNVSTGDYIGGETSGGNCRSNIIGRKTFGDNQWLVGDVFLKNVYSVFDFDKLQVGFGVKSGDEKVASASGSASLTATPGKESQTSLLTTRASSPNEPSIGPSAAASRTSPADGTTEATAESQQTPGASPSAKGTAAGTRPASFAALSIAILLSMFI